MAPSAPARLRALLTVTVLTVVTLVAPTATTVTAVTTATAAPLAVTGASAAPASSCSASTGVLVVVDLRHFGGSLTRGCDPTPSTGWNALVDAGYSVAGTARYPNTFVCRIDGHPSTRQDPCINTPPASAYWSYWHADAGRNSWTYSTTGAQSYHPKAGSIDAWVFGSTDVAGTSGGPSFTPAEARGQRSGGGAPSSTRPGSGSTTHHSGSGSGATRTGTPAGTGARSATTSPTSAAPSAATAAGSGTAATGAPSPSRSSGNRTAAAASSSADGPSGPASGAAAGPTFADASAVADRRSSPGGSAWPVILGAALVLLLGAGAGLGVLRRRRADIDDH